jgi:hypothetical protein
VFPIPIDLIRPILDIMPKPPAEASPSSPALPPQASKSG